MGGQPIMGGLLINWGVDPSLNYDYVCVCVSVFVCVCVCVCVCVWIDILKFG